jgi:hypothetical protein
MVDEVKTLRKQLTPFEVKLMCNQTLRSAIYQIAFFIVKVFNRIDAEAPELLYLIPEKVVEIPFEIFRGFKRSHTPLYESEEGRKLYGAEEC